VLRCAIFLQLLQSALFGERLSKDMFSKQKTRIIFQNQLFVAVSKPPHTPVHPSSSCPRQAKNTRAYLIDEVSDLLGRRVYPVHRLDAQTSGVTLLALSSEAAATMQTVLKDKVNTIKEYITFVRGATPDKWVNTKPLKKLRFDDEKGEPQEAETYFETIARFSYCSLLKARPITGRTHQIRRHLASEAHQIIGDRQYGKGRLNNTARDLYGLQRVFLHAYRLEFIHPTTKEKIILRDPLPEDLVAFLRKLPDFKEEYIQELL